MKRAPWNLSEGIQARPEGSRQCFIDQGNRLTGLCILFREAASSTQWNPHRLQVAFTDDADETFRMVAAFEQLALRRNIPASISGQRQHIRQAGRTYSGNDRTRSRTCLKEMFLWACDE